ncbi:class I SAM-dependent methyltransferase [Tsuneonella sp. YG55]|uniref:Class I SAM-dependent methyltransferase n=1 Tax=Tsuneonella litorea TaxID=2976475 RepID=A0A9X3ALW7_9SPHN|nr:class I SAM-dependent methyltransferase [Tsuneonella litorea]MCT2559713.1 class I SAM-dependent methyltransferase [Tsuneonella litorea]
MTSKHLTGLLAKDLSDHGSATRTFGERLFQIGFALVQWPWLLKSLYGGTQAEKRALLERVELELDALPHLGSWKADTYLLHRIVDEIEARKPAVVVELGSGATSLVIAKALLLHGGGSLHSYDQHEPFVRQMDAWLDENGLSAAFHYAPLTLRDAAWPGLWYALSHLPPRIDLLVIDGPPWAVHPFARGMAERLFDRITPGGAIMLDDAARPGERVIARRWRKRWKDFDFLFEGGGAKGLLVGRRSADGNHCGA